ncbi:hypothetical protein M0805_000861 [Coniferiporia weirii]|nr:hypothetical protein M0805_000861 [Coniferiporia weirii]
MTTRPALATKSKRPLSAIFLGSPSQLPDLPDPPSSPGSSGLPSPPATNSTGSGSNGGDNNTSAGSVRVPASLTMQNGSSSSMSAPRSMSRSPSDDGDDGNDEDQTARLSDDRRLASVKDNQSALQRVKSLTQRNRLVLNKLASISSGSRLSTPSPTAVKRLSRSPAPSSSNSVNSSSRSSNSSARKRSESYSRASGSETERELLQNATSSSEDLSETPTSTISSHFRSASVKERRTSAPITPSNELARISSVEQSRPSENYVTGRRMQRPESRTSGDIEAAALAAVANSRRNSPSDTRRRQPLPREFRGGKSSQDGDVLPEPPLTPRKNRGSPGLHSNRNSPSSRAATLQDSPQSPRRTQRYSTVREITRKRQTRWLSQDLMSSQGDAPDEDGRPQARRGGSNESPLITGGRSVIGESLRAAGLTRRREDDDIFADTDVGRRLRLSSDLGARPSISRTEARTGTRLSDRPMTADDLSYLEPRTPANTTHDLARRNVQTVQADRPATSMAAYRDEPRTAPPLLRTYRSAHPLPEKERETPTAEEPVRPLSQARNVYPISSAASNERSASTLGRRTALSPLNLAAAAEFTSPDSTPEHTRLMLESLGMFESQLARLPSMGSTTTVTIPELFRSAQNIVHATNALSNLLRNGTAHALEEQIDAELGEEGLAIDLVGLWRDVGAEYRESVRISDELVRTMTSFLLGVGKVLRESTTDKPHNRTISLDETVSRRLTPDTLGAGRTSEGKLSSDGGSSRLDGKRRWEGSSGGMGGTTTSFTSMQSSSLHSSSSSRPSTGSKVRTEAETDVLAPEPPGETSAAMKRLVRLSLVAPRRPESLQDLRDTQPRDIASAMQLSYSEDDAQAVDSPLSAVSAARKQGTLPRRANSLAMPAPLPTLLSESLISRRTSVRPVSVNRRPKMSTASNATVRAATSIFPSIATPGEPTTAVSTTQVSPGRPSLASLRTNGSSNRTFSRASGTAAAGLQQQMERDGRKRTNSANSALESEALQARSATDSEQADRRTRVSLNGSNSGTFTTRSGRDRRGTVTGLFTRA